MLYALENLSFDSKDKGKTSKLCSVNNNSNIIWQEYLLKLLQDKTISNLCSRQPKNYNSRVSYKMELNK